MLTKNAEFILRRLREMLPEPLSQTCFEAHEIDKFGLSETEFLSAVSSLARQSLIQLRVQDSINNRHEVEIKMLPDAYGYFEEKEERKQKERESKLSNRRWDLFKIVLSFFFGLLSGILLTIFSTNYKNTKMPKHAPIQNTVSSDNK